MKTKIILLAFFCAVFLISCARFNVRTLEQPSLKQSFFNGVEVLESKKSTSYVRFEVAQKAIGGASDEPLVIFIAACILDSKNPKKRDRFLETQNSVVAFPQSIARSADLEVSSWLGIAKGEGATSQFKPLPLSEKNTKDSKTALQKISILKQRNSFLDSNQQKSIEYARASEDKAEAEAEPSGIRSRKGDTSQGIDSKSVIFDLSNITASQNGKEVEILSYEDAKNSNLNFSQAIESFGIFTPQNPYASGIAPSMPPYPMLIYRGYPGFFIYDPWFFSARDRIEQSMRLEENRRVKSIILSSYLSKNTLEKGQNPRGGFIAINQHKLKKGTLTLQVKILKDTHTLEIELSK